ncbi:MAG: hypothetical protein ACD_42C00189G0002 [uncultured bacterium]|nr:MAG: hypothetical protein ACD_42C00189G0002 [uncultured bacterium]OGT33538.1 MAG: hypothetical protein A3C44_01435 [Gammaproteobacteria bacterium RIFCSPHIGHO2_02_FULL_39_13]OGT49553.1 MAG: hypothetical protein A3E53_00180 [Gammaproteobacteria bacterium RIFCSPHIGHO2_12_FULL_39_24]
MTFKKIIFICVFLPATLFSAVHFPPQCRVSGLRYSKHAILFFSQHTAKPRLYVMTNISKNLIWLTHERKNPGVGAGWDSQLRSKRWSALLVTQRQLDLQCHVQLHSGTIKMIPCEKVLRACQFSQFYFQNPMSGGFWVVEDLPIKALEKRIQARGFHVTGLQQQ